MGAGTDAGSVAPVRPELFGPSRRKTTVGVLLLISMVAVYVLIAVVYPERTRPAVFGLMSSAWVLPSLIGPPVAGVDFARRFHPETVVRVAPELDPGDTRMRWQRPQGRVGRAGKRRIR